MSIVIEQTEAKEATGFHKFVPDVYEAIVADIAEVDNPFEEDKTQLEWSFEVPGETNEDGTIAKVRGWCNPVFNKNTKLYAWCEVLLGKVEAGAPMETADLIGKRCRVVLTAGTNQKGEPVTKLTNLLPTKIAAPKGIVAALKADGCSVPNCKKPLSVYDADANAFCEKHAPDPDE